jgi:hypothetical protein
MEKPSNLSSLDTNLLQTTIESWGSREAWYRVISVLPRYLPIGWYRYGTSVVYVWAKLTLLLIYMLYMVICMRRSKFMTISSVIAI